MRKVYNLFFYPGEVTELRALGLKGANRAWEGRAGGKGGTVSGYFDDGDKLAAAAKALDDALARGVYFTINPCKEVLLSRASNRLICPQEDTTTTDQHIKCLRWFLIDVDAKLADGSHRPKGVSASETELAACEETAKRVATWLEQEIGFARAIRAFSGNGYHLMYRLADLPNDETHRLLIKNMMAGLAAKFGDDIDVSVVNPARIWKLYGTTGRKGDSSQERPHRASYVFEGQPERLDDIPITPLEILVKLAALSPSAAPSGPGVPGSLPARKVDQGAGPSPTRRLKKGELGPLDMERYLAAHGISFNVKATQDATLYRLEKCIFNADHGMNEAAVVVPAKGAIKYQCFHDSCKSEKRTWKDARKAISGDKSIAEFCIGYNPNWQPAKEISTGILDELPIEPDLMMERWRAGLNKELPPALEIDPSEFHEKRGKRPVYVPDSLVRYVVNSFYPLRFTDDIFYQYKGGVWKVLIEGEIGKFAYHALKNRVQADWITSAIKLMKNAVHFLEKEWQENPLLLNVKNGMVDMEKKIIIPHDPDHNSRTQLPVPFEPTAQCPKWLKFLKDIFPEDDNDEKKFLLQQFFGYCLLRDCRFQKALFMYGTGSNGKDTVLHVLEAMVGSENVSYMPLADLCKTFKPAHLQNKLVNLATETNTREVLAMDIFKQIVGGGSITTERKYGQQFSFQPYCKFISAMNDMPVITDKSHGFARRIISLVFTRRFEQHEMISHFERRLFDELPGIFKWAMEGWAVLLSHDKFVIPDQVAKDTAHLITTLNPQALWMLECCEYGQELYQHKPSAYKSYRQWCNDGQNRPVSRNNFYAQVIALKPEIKETQRDGKRAFRGVRLNNDGIKCLERYKRQHGDDDDDDETEE